MSRKLEVYKARNNVISPTQTSDIAEKCALFMIGSSLIKVHWWLFFMLIYTAAVCTEMTKQSYVCQMGNTT